MTHYWRLHCRLPERHKTPCRILVTGKMGSMMIEFEDGMHYVVSRRSVRKLKQ
jgi:hypothetical protein